MKIVGLDISTSTIGRAVINFSETAKIEYVDFYKPIKHTIEDKNMDFLYMLSEAKKGILNLIEEHRPDYIAVEDCIRFLKGGSGAATILPLFALNKAICLGIYEDYPLIPLHICNVISIRTRLKKDLGLLSLPPKEEVPACLEKLMKIEIPRPMKKTRKGEKIADEFLDMADGIAVAYYCHRLLQEKK
jgi:hypothetical protein